MFPTRLNAASDGLGAFIENEIRCADVLNTDLIFKYIQTNILRIQVANMCNMLWFAQ